MIRPTHPDGTPLTIREQIERTSDRKAKRSAKALFLWPKRAMAGPPRPRKTRSKPSDYQRLRAKADAIWALLVKTRDKLLGNGLCRICGRNPITVAYHVLQRGYLMVRWDIENGVGACSGCNYWEVKTRQQNPQAVRNRHVNIFGEAFIARLEEKKNRRGKLDLPKIIEGLQSDLRLLVIGKFIIGAYNDH